MKTNQLVLITLSALVTAAACRSGLDDRSDAELDMHPALIPQKFREMFERYAAKQPHLLDCAGYLTELESEGFCSTDVPRDWVPFEYDGATYFVQPLARQRQ